MRGVTEYRSGWVRISFPYGDVSCRWCPLLSTERIANGYRSFCKRTGEFIASPNDTRGGWCPLEMEDEDANIQASDGG